MKQIVWIVAAFFLVDLCTRAAAAPIGASVSLENRFVKRSWTTEGGVLRTISIVNNHAGLPAAPASGDEFRLRVSESADVEGTDRTLTTSDFKLAGVERKNVGGVESVTFHLESAEFTADVKAWLAADDFYLRKQLTLTAKKPLTLERIDVEALNLADATQPYQLNQITARAPAGFKPNLGQPLYGAKTGTFWGVEFPASLNRADGGKLTCGYQHGRAMEAGKAITSYPSVMGVSDDPAFVADAFYDYIDRIRIRPFHLQVQYNTWFDMGRGVDAASFKQRVQAIHEELVRQRGVRPLDAYVIDSGWENLSVSWVDKYWPVNTKKFDADFASTFKAVQAADSHLGLWMNPGLVFSATAAVGELRKAGFEALGQWMSLAGPRHMAALEDRMAELTRQGVAFYKLDGVFGELNNREYELHGKRYGLPEMPQLGAGSFSPSDARLNDPKYDELKIYYLSASTERLMRCLDHIAAINPKVHIVLSNAAYLSPWWLQHADTIWMINSDDGATGSGRTGELVYRDARLHRLSVTERTQFPLNAVFNHEPKKTGSEPPEAFRRYLYMAFSRGTGFLELYLKPTKLKPADWDVLAEGLLWTELTGPAFKRSRMHGGDPAKEEAYGFTGWLKEGGYVSIHNPSTKNAVTYRFTIDRSLGVVPGSGPFVVSSPLADSTRDLKPNCAYGQTLEVSLAPREVRILNFSEKGIDWIRLRALQEREKKDSTPTNP